ncbi:MAG: MerR family transcriptional regulator [Rhodospirillaceae bacterium]|nr:MerR family transcriptional regulator [Rhodospirillaceae bacterium]MBT7268683.1 MerR family transcriptional regulator [Rhodospirillaceae bacterium]
MLSSKELMEKAGVSRATLNNYIGMGLIPKPIIKNPSSTDDKANDRARRLGYFPEEALDRLREIDEMKKSGMRMATIIDALADDSPKAKAKKATASASVPDPEFSPTQGRGLQLTIDKLEHPAYLVNNKFEIEWSNVDSETEIFGQYSGLSSDIVDRNIFRLLFEGDQVTKAESREEILQFHLSIAKNRMSKAALLTANPTLDSDQFGELTSMYDGVTAIESRAMQDTEVNFAPRNEEPRRFRLYASFFREGIFFTYVPVDSEDQSILTLLSRRDLVIRDLLKSRKPYLTPMAVLVADLQDSVKICAELPPDEYFELINQIWGTMEPIFRQFYATHGKHVGDGMVYYFFPQPDCNYIFNAIQCAYEMKEAMKAISQEWRMKKNWTNELRLNTGLDEGQEWFGAYQTPTHLEFTVLGDTINRAARLSDFARNSSIWVTKNLIASMIGADREKITYGIRRDSADGEEILVPSTFGRLSNLIDLNDPRNLKLNDIGVLPVTEIIDMAE